MVGAERSVGAGAPGSFTGDSGMSTEIEESGVCCGAPPIVLRTSRPSHPLARMTAQRRRSSANRRAVHSCISPLTRWSHRRSLQPGPQLFSRCTAAVIEKRRVQ